VHKPQQTLNPTRLSKSRQATPLLKPSQPQPRTLIDPNPAISHHHFTAEVVHQRPSQLKREHLVTSVLHGAQWKAQGAIAFIGAHGWEKELALVAEHVAAVLGRHVDAYDTYSAITYDSLLDSARIATAVRIQTAPTIHPRVRVHDGIPDFSNEERTLIFACLGKGRWEWLRTLKPALFDRATLIGEHEDIRALAKAKKFRLRYLSRWQSMVAVVCEC